ncbi:MAG: hypothetical protein QGG40_18695, partial [Myxococcota bacterium]|nr:hypothetical protein [Myxococcota bacterium]
FYALVGNEDEALLFELSVRNNGNFKLEQDGLEVDGTFVACGDFAVGGVAVSNDDGNWTSFDASYNEAASGSLGDIEALTAGDPDGDGIVELLSCAEEGCSIVAVDLDSDGADEIVTGGETLMLEGWEETVQLSGSGTVSAADADGDGTADLLAANENSGLLLVFRGLTGGVAPPQAYHTSREFHGPLHVSDVTGDGVPEIVIPGTDGTITHTAASEVDEDTAW